MKRTGVFWDKFSVIPFVLGLVVSVAVPAVTEAFTYDLTNEQGEKANQINFLPNGISLTPFLFNHFNSDS